LNVPARALDNLLFVVGVNRVGEEGDLRYMGKSKIANPRGRILTQAESEGEYVLVMTIDLDEVAMFRRQVLYLTDRRPETYRAVVT
jgi:predicted amidohydrolase